MRLTCTCMHTNTHNHARARARAHTHTHTHTHTKHVYTHTHDPSAPHDRYQRGSSIGRAHAGAQAIAASSDYSMALKKDGTVWATGWNGYGQLGDGTTSHKSSFVKVFSGQ